VKISSFDFTTVSVPYTHREDSAQVNRDGVTSVIVKVQTDDGVSGWGEACSGANVESVLEALRALEPLIKDRDPWNREAIWYDCYQKGIWNFREGTFNFAFAGIDMALWDICGKASAQPVYNLLGGLRRSSVDYFYYLSGANDLGRLQEDCRQGVEAGYRVFYIKTGIDFEKERAAIELIRQTIGPSLKIRIDSNQAWTVGEAVRYLNILDEWDIDFAEQPVLAEPLDNMIELRSKTPVPLASNEGLWRISDAWQVIKRRACDVICFSPYWVGTIGQFARLSHAAVLEGMRVCKHTHGELGIAAAAGQHALLALPGVVDGNQHTAHMMSGDVLRESLPIASGPTWPVDNRPGLGVEPDNYKIGHYHKNYENVGQYQPYSLDRIRAAWPESRP
jgi:glucarate dehydratase